MIFGGFRQPTQCEYCAITHNFYDRLSFRPKTNGLSSHIGGGIHWVILQQIAVASLDSTLNDAHLLTLLLNDNSGGTITCSMEYGRLCSTAHTRFECSRVLGNLRIQHYNA